MHCAASANNTQILFPSRKKPTKYSCVLKYENNQRFLQFCRLTYKSLAAFTRKRFDKCGDVVHFPNCHSKHTTSHLL